MKTIYAVHGLLVRAETSSGSSKKFTFNPNAEMKAILIALGVLLILAVIVLAVASRFSRKLSRTITGSLMGAMLLSAMFCFSPDFLEGTVNLAISATAALGEWAGDMLDKLPGGGGGTSGAGSGGVSLE